MTHVSWFSRHRRALGRCLLALTLLLAMAGGAAFGFLTYVLASAPELSEVSVSPHGYRTAVLDDAGEVMVTLAGEESNRVYVTLDQIPIHLQNAFIAIEDERFYRHGGIDLRGIARALWQDVTTGSLSQGASTITQQLIKNNVFSSFTEESTAMDKITRKLQEQYLAVRLEKSTSKAWILENYLNTINLGGGTWGVQTAALRYFGKEVSDLTLSESAVIAAITKSPTALNPLKHPEENRSRQRLVLAGMLEQGMISQEEHDAALADDVYARLQETDTGSEIPIFSYFEDTVISQVAEDLETELGYSETDAWQAIYRGGLTIETTQNTALQSICEEEIDRTDRYATDAQATLVLLDSATGAVKAIVGGRGEKTASLTWNRAVSSVRQPGSTIKVVGEYAAALESGAVTLATVYDDAPYTYSNGTPIRNASGSYGGRTTVRKAIAASTNTVALRCFQEAGMDAVWTCLEDFGFSHLDEDDRVEALALGGTHGGVTNLELTAAYAAIANGGVYSKPYCYTRVLDREGHVLLEHTPHQRRVLSETTAALLRRAMEDVMTAGTGTAAAFSGQALAGKSGTTSDLRDLWFVGFSPSLVCGAWSGYDDFSSQDSSAYVKWLWRSVMQRAHEGLERQSFDGPGTLESRTICTKCGKLAVEGLCSETVQGNMTLLEWFAPGTAPTERCDCHVAVELCETSGEVAGFYCRERERRVYLKEGTAGTADETAVAPEERCSEHLHWWDWMFPDGDGAAEDEPAEPQTPALPQEPASDYRWWDWRSWFGHL